MEIINEKNEGRIKNEKKREKNGVEGPGIETRGKRRGKVLWEAAVEVVIKQGLMEVANCPPHV